MKLLIGGDFCITPKYYFFGKDLFDKSVIDLFAQSDYNILNLECPIAQDNDNNKILKTGPHLRTDDTIFNYLNQLNMHAVTLANNHILDYGEKGLKNTIELCQKNNVRIVGAGINKIKAAEPLIIEHEDLKIAFVNFCENEWSTLDSYTARANHMDIIDNFNQINKAKQKADFVIVIVHGGHEYYPLPSPRMVKQYRFYAENGADAVIGHHAHCYSGYEVYNNVPIAYSLGNLLFTLDSIKDAWYTGLIAQLQIEKNKPIHLEFIPVLQEKQTFKLSLQKKKEKEFVFKNVEKLSNIIKSNNYLQQEWKDFIKQNYKLIDTLSPINYISNKYIRAILKHLGINRFILNESFLKSITNRFRCEAHRDLTTEILTEKLKDK